MQELENIKKAFIDTINCSLGRYIRIKRVNTILINDKKSEKYHHKIIFHYISTQLGTMVACYTNNALCLLEFIDRKMLERELITVQEKLQGYYSYNNKLDICHKVSTQINEYFSGKRQKFSLPLSLT